MRQKAITQVMPVCPALAEGKSRRAYEGDVSVRISIAEDGRVMNARSADGPRLLQEASKFAALRWRFQPTLVKGKAVKVNSSLTFRYQLVFPSDTSARHIVR